MLNRFYKHIRNIITFASHQIERLPFENKFIAPVYLGIIYSETIPSVVQSKNEAKKKKFEIMHTIDRSATNGTRMQIYQNLNRKITHTRTLAKQKTENP